MPHLTDVDRAHATGRLQAGVLQIQAAVLFGVCPHLQIQVPYDGGCQRQVVKWASHEDISTDCFLTDLHISCKGFQETIAVSSTQLDMCSGS